MLLLWFVLLQILWMYQYQYAGGQLVATIPPDLIKNNFGFTIRTDQPFRDTVYQTVDYACGRVNFCNSSIAKYDNSWSCLDCRLCKCDGNCSYFGDCCPDLLFRDSAQKSAKSSPYVSCEKRYLKWRKLTKQPYLFMVTKCPGDYVADDSVKIKCEKAVASDFEQANPVSSVKPQLTYRNKFCAICHGFAEHQLWKLRVECGTSGSLNSASDKNQLWKTVLDNPTCQFENSPPNDIRIRTCFGDPVKTCSPSWRLEAKNEYIETLCRMYSHPVQNGNQLYNNVFCAVCNGVGLNRNAFCNVPPIVLPREVTYPLSVLIDFNPRPKLLDQAGSSQDAEKKCNDSETNNPFSGQCEKLKCRPRRILSDSFCETFYSSTKGLGYSFSMIIKFSEKLSQSSWSTVPVLYQERLRQEFAAYLPFVFSSLVMTSFRKAVEIMDDQGQTMVSEEVTGMKITAKMVSTSSRPVPEMEQRIKDVQSFSFSMEVELRNVTLTSIPVVCSESLREGLPEGESGPAFAVAAHSRELNCSEDCLESVVYETVYNTLDCPYLEFNLTTSNFTFNIDNSTIVFNNQTIHLNRSGYEICGDNLKLCLTVLQHIQKEMKKLVSDRPIPEEGATPALTIVSIVCIALSLLCLFITFLIYCILPQLRTLPGKNTMSLIFHLFCAQLFFQVGIRMTYNESLCRAMGLLIHYFWMASFAWMAACAHHMYAVFTQMTANRSFNRTDETKNIVRTILICNVSALVVVAACIAYHLGTSRGELIGYGGRICFLNEPVDIGIFFAAPLGVVLIFNTFCFIRTVMAIRNVPDMKDAKNKDNRNHVLVYFRLSVLLGFTWVFGFIAAAIQTESLWYVFVILNGLQGVLIFIAYCANRRTRDMLTKRIGRKVSVKYRAGERSRSSEANTASTAL